MAATNGHVPNMDDATIAAAKLPAKETETHIYFFGYETGSPYDCFQQWYPSKFVDAALTERSQGRNDFKTSEQYMMAMKAMMMKDNETAQKIMDSDTPADAKTLGREVKNFNQRLWDMTCDAVVERANWLKFGQNDDLARILLGTGDKEIVEASPSDRIWGIGFDLNNAEGREAEWGTNKLGKALMRVRQRIRSGEQEGEWPRIVVLEGCTSCGSCGGSHKPDDLVHR